MITKQCLRLGNIFKEGVVCKINGRAGAKVHLCGQLEYKNGELRNRTEVAVEHLTPIELSPEVLVEWCGFEKALYSYELKGFLLNYMENGSYMFYTSWDGGWAELREIDYLHELQNLYHVLTKSELEIRE